MLVTGIIASRFGWESVFYIEGVVAAIWLPLWWLLISDRPQTQTLISQEERDYIVSSLNTDASQGTAEVSIRKQIL